MSLSIDDLILVHVTHVRPALCDGRLVMKTGGCCCDSYDASDNKIFVREQNFSKPRRMTLHWSLNGVTRIAGFKQGGTTIYGIPARYAIIEPISALKEELWGGSFDDMYSLGDHTISSQAFIFVPEDEPDIDQLDNIATVIRYRGYVEGFTNNHMRDMIASFLTMV